MSTSRVNPAELQYVPPPYWVDFSVRLGLEEKTRLHTISDARISLLPPRSRRGCKNGKYDA